MGCGTSSYVIDKKDIIKNKKGQKRKGEGKKKEKFKTRIVGEESTTSNQLSYEGMKKNNQLTYEGMKKGKVDGDESDSSSIFSVSSCSSESEEEDVVEEIEREFVDHNTSEHRRIQNQVGVLENRLDGMRAKYSESIEENRKLREEIKNFKEEKVFFDAIYQKMGEELDDVAEEVKKDDEDKDQKELEGPAEAKIRAKETEGDHHRFHELRNIEDELNQERIRIQKKKLLPLFCGRKRHPLLSFNNRKSAFRKKRRKRRRRVLPPTSITDHMLRDEKSDDDDLFLIKMKFPKKRREFKDTSHLKVKVPSEEVVVEEVEKQERENEKAQEKYIYEDDLSSSIRRVQDFTSPKYEWKESIREKLQFYGYNGIEYYCWETQTVFHYPPTAQSKNPLKWITTFFHSNNAYC